MTTTTTFKFTIAVLLILCLGMVGCSDSTLTTLSKSLVDVSQAVGTLQTTVIQANQAGTISSDDTSTILTICQKINAGGQQASMAIRALTKLSPADKSNVFQVIKPLADVVNSAVSSGLVGIKDAGTKSKVMGILQVIQTGLNSAVAVTAVTS